MNNKILIVEDDPDLGNLLKQYLMMNGFDADRVYNGAEAFNALMKTSYDLLILDVMMPEEDGFSLAKKLNTYYKDLPFFFVTAKKMREDILEGLKLGADDYIIKPFDADELILRIKNILRRIKKAADEEETIFKIGAYLFDRKNLTLSSKNITKVLTDKEAQLLYFLCSRQHQLIKREEILVYLWKEPDFFNGRSMDVFISRLRKLLVADPSIHIESVRGIGFRFYIDKT
ncbi:MAG: response regulator transcription factor [Mucilaginibacter sp.]